MLQKILLLAAGLLVCMTTGYQAAAQDLTAELSQIFDAYNAASKAGEADMMISLRTAEMRKEIRRDIKKKEDRELFVLLGRAQTPESYEAQHVAVAKDGKTATLYILAQYAAMPEVERPRSRMEAAITFNKENGKWKMKSLLPLGDPDKIARPKNLNYNPKAADLDREGSIGGRIVKIEFKPGYTLVMVRVMDEENAVFLPDKEKLQESGISVEELVRWNIFEFSGHPHKKDKLKFFATRGRLVKE
jgi:hypothetical protein